jgi:demethylmenaquinone methyltransferase/2-methoxy-6-polyprenyl-1,4-benzoquinol methylase
MSRPESTITRVTTTRAEAAAAYDRLSGFYDLLSGPAERKLSQAALQLLDVSAGQNLLEIGFGTGHGLLALARVAGQNGRVCGIDLSPGMLAVARARIAKAGQSGVVRLLHGDAAWIPFASNTFDAVFMSFTLELFDTPQISQVLSECRRVLRDGGRIGVVALSKGSSGLVVRLYERLHQMFPKYIDCRPIYVHRALEKAGFATQVALGRSLWGLPVEIVVAENDRAGASNEPDVSRVPAAGMVSV